MVQFARHSERSAAESRNLVVEAVGSATGSLDFARDDPKVYRHRQANPVSESMSRRLAMLPATAKATPQEQAAKAACRFAS